MRTLLTEFLRMRDWAAAMLVEKLQLSRPLDVMGRDHRGRHPVPGTEWSYRTHGIGVDVYHNGRRGGVDFDFDPYSESGNTFRRPDWWRLFVFAEYAIEEGRLSEETYRSILSNGDRFRELTDLVVNERFG